MTATSEMMKMDGFDHCIIGTAMRFGMSDSLCYDYEKVVETNVKRGMTRREAEDWFGYNMLGSWVGETTPVFVMLKEKK
jgi:hypothetical protein